MSNVRRVFVEKKPEFAVEANHQSYLNSFRLFES